MKTLRILSLSACFLAISAVSFSQTKTETFKVSGNCGMCKSKIEKAAKDGGAQTAVWDEETKELVITYKSGSANTAKIQEKIAKVGYDNAGAKASKESYDKLHGCCKYDRAANVEKAGCCSEGSTCTEGHESKHAAKMDCCKDGKCTMDAKEGCCKDGKCTMAAKEGCCKDGKCSKEGHSGADCCKKS